MNYFSSITFRTFEMFLISNVISVLLKIFSKPVFNVTAHLQERMSLVAFYAAQRIVSTAVTISSQKYLTRKRKKNVGTKLYCFVNFKIFVRFIAMSVYNHYSGAQCRIFWTRKIIFLKRSQTKLTACQKRQSLRYTSESEICILKMCTNTYFDH